MHDLVEGSEVHAMYLWNRKEVTGKEFFPATVKACVGDHPDAETLGPMYKVVYDEDGTIEDVPQFCLRQYDGPVLNRDPESLAVGVVPRKRGRAGIGPPPERP
jgi:hypothetical protein